MVEVNIHEAKTQLSKLLRRVEAGEEVILARAGRPIARLVPYDRGTEGRRRLGRDAGLVEVSDDFDDPIPEDLLEEFET